VIDAHDGGGGLGGQLGIVDVVVRSLEVEEFDCVGAKGVVSEVVVDWGTGGCELEERVEDSAGWVGVF